MELMGTLKWCTTSRRGGRIAGWDESIRHPRDIGLLCVVRMHGGLSCDLGLCWKC